MGIILISMSLVYINISRMLFENITYKLYHVVWLKIHGSNLFCIFALLGGLHNSHSGPRNTTHTALFSYLNKTTQTL